MTATTPLSTIILQIAGVGGAAWLSGMTAQILNLSVMARDHMHKKAEPELSHHNLFDPNDTDPLTPFSSQETSEVSH